MKKPPAMLNREDKEKYRLHLRRYLGVPDDVKDEKLDAIIEHSRINKITHPADWIRERLAMNK